MGHGGWPPSRLDLCGLCVGSVWALCGLTQTATISLGFSAIREESALPRNYLPQERGYVRQTRSRSKPRPPACCFLPQIVCLGGFGVIFCVNRMLVIKVLKKKKVLPQVERKIYLDKTKVHIHGQAWDLYWSLIPQLETVIVEVFTVQALTVESLPTLIPTAPSLHPLIVKGGNGWRGWHCSVCWDC